MKAIHIKRLRKLIAFLKTLDPTKFDFWVVRKEEVCGTVGCAIGWTPNVFPRSIVARHSRSSRMEYVVQLAKDKAVRWDIGFEKVARWLTGLPGEKASALFMPTDQTLVHPKLPVLFGDATPKQVAKMLEKFIKLQTTK